MRSSHLVTAAFVMIKSQRFIRWIHLSERVPDVQQSLRQRDFCANEATAAQNKPSPLYPQMLPWDWSRVVWYCAGEAESLPALMLVSYNTRRLWTTHSSDLVPMFSITKVKEMKRFSTNSDVAPIKSKTVAQHKRCPFMSLKPLFLILILLLLMMAADYTYFFTHV